MYNAHNWSLVDKATAEGDDDDDVPPPDAYEIEKKFEMVSTFPLPLLKGRSDGTREMLYSHTDKSIYGSTMSTFSLLYTCSSG